MIRNDYCDRGAEVAQTSKKSEKSGPTEHEPLNIAVWEVSDQVVVALPTPGQIKCGVGFLN